MGQRRVENLGRPLVSAAIVTRGGRQLRGTLSCFLSDRFFVENGELYVVLNGVEPPHYLRPMLRESGIRGKLIMTSANVSVPYLFNLVLLEVGGEFFLKSDDDVRFGPGTIQCLVDALRKEEEVGIIGPAVINPRWGKGTEYGAKICKTTGTIRVLTERPETEIFTDLDYVIGCFALTRTWLARALKFEEFFGIYWDDISFCLRVKSLGFKVGVVTTATVVHDAPPPPPVRRFLWFHRNRILTLHETPLEEALKVPELAAFYLMLTENTKETLRTLFATVRPPEKPVLYGKTSYAAAVAEITGATGIYDAISKKGLGGIPFYDLSVRKAHSVLVLPLFYRREVEDFLKDRADSVVFLEDMLREGVKADTALREAYRKALDRVRKEGSVFANVGIDMFIREVEAIGENWERGKGG